jgi:hypothetical protein
VQAVSCDAGVCAPAGCTDAGACAFTPDNIVVPAKAVKYNVRSTAWPFCGTSNFLSVVVEMTEGSGETDDGATCNAPDCELAECTEEEEAAIAACMDAGTVQADCEAVDGCTYTAGTTVEASTCTDADLTNTDGTAESEPSPALCPDGCSYSHSVADDGTLTESCLEATGDVGVGDVAGLEVTFKGRSPNVDVCSTADNSCINIKFGKIEERKPDGVFKVNAHSIMSLASQRNLPTWTTGTMTHGSSDQVTFVKMALDRTFSRSCTNRDGGAADANARPRPNRRAAAVQMGSMVAQMPTKAMISAAVADTEVAGPQTPTNITVTTTDKGVEFVFPAFDSLYYDPIVASESSFEDCTSCENVDPDSTTDSTADAEGGTKMDVNSSSFGAPAVFTTLIVLALMHSVA